MSISIAVSSSPFRIVFSKLGIHRQEKLWHAFCHGKQRRTKKRNKETEKTEAQARNKSANGKKDFQQALGIDHRQNLLAPEAILFLFILGHPRQPIAVFHNFTCEAREIPEIGLSCSRLPLEGVEAPANVVILSSILPCRAPRLS